MAQDSYEDLTDCGLSPDQEAEMLRVVKECVFMWTNSDGEAFGVVMSMLPKDGKIWLTCAEARKRVPALRRFPRASICVNGTGWNLGGSKTMTYKGTCVIRDDRKTKDWFFPEFSKHLRPNDADAAAAFAKFLDSPARVIIEFTPDYKLGFDSAKMWKRSPEVDKGRSRPD